MAAEAAVAAGGPGAACLSQSPSVLPACRPPAATSPRTWERRNLGPQGYQVRT